MVPKTPNTPPITPVVGNVLEPIELTYDLVDEILRVTDHDLYLPDRGDDYQKQRHDDDDDQDEENPDHGYDPRYPETFEATYEGIEGVGQDAGGQEGQQHAAYLPHEGHKQHDSHREHDVLEICRDDQFSG
jgi:hypothetical protein